MLIIALMTPMFLSAADGNIAFARVAAADTLESYRAETHADLITVAKIIAFGLATLGSLCMSMADDLSVSQILRLRSNANALDRSEHRNRLALTASRSVQHAAPLSEQEPDIDTLTAAAQQMQRRTAQNLANITGAASTPPAAVWAPTPAPTPAPAPVLETGPAPTAAAAALTPGSPAAETAGRDAAAGYQASWAAAAATLAADTVVSRPTLPPNERHPASLSTDRTNDPATAFMAGDTSGHCRHLE